MSELLKKRHFLIHEHVGAAALHESYDILDAQTRQKIGIAVEEAGLPTKLAKLFLDKNLLSCTVRVADEHGKTILQLKRARGVVKPIRVFDGQEQLLAEFKPSLFSCCGTLAVSDAQGENIGSVRGDWRGKKYLFTDLSGQSIGEIIHQNSGATQEWLTTADNYSVKLFAGEEKMPLLLAAAITVDLAFHEG
jgi:uncharacterized protein YxjI